VRAQARGAGSPKGSRLQTGRVDLVTASQSQVALDSVGTPSVSRPGAPPLKGHAVGSAEKPDRPGPERGTWSFGQVDAGARAAVPWASCVASVTWRRALGNRATHAWPWPAAPSPRPITSRARS